MTTTALWRKALLCLLPLGSGLADDDEVMVGSLHRSQLIEMLAVGVRHAVYSLDLMGAAVELLLQEPEQ